MAEWKDLKTDYMDAVWSGLKKYEVVNNEDDTVSFNDVTEYSNKDKSYFGAMDANQINEAVNTIMQMVNNGTDLYSAFQRYFDTQKNQFETQSAANMSSYSTQFNNWFNGVKNTLSGDVAGNLANRVSDLEASKLSESSVYPVWSSSTSYKRNDLVSWEGNLYRCIANNATGYSVTNRIYWRQVTLENDTEETLPGTDITLSIVGKTVMIAAHRKPWTKGNVNSNVGSSDIPSPAGVNRIIVPVFDSSIGDTNFGNYPQCGNAVVTEGGIYFTIPNSANITHISFSVTYLS